MRRLSFWCFLLIVMCGAAVAQDNPSFASSPAYKSMLEELSHEYPRPSRIAAAGELWKGTRPATPAKESDSAKTLSIETDFWKLNVGKDPFGITFANKLTGAEWRLGGADFHTPGIVWTSRGMSDTKSPASGPGILIARIQRSRKQDNEWTLEAVVSGSTQPVQIHLSVPSPNLVCISIDASAFGPETQSQFRVSAAAPYFGLGEQFPKISQEGIKINLRPDDLAWAPGHFWDYMSIPFIYGPQGNGIYFDTALNTVFDSTALDSPGFTLQFGGPSVDVYLIAAKGPKEVLESYTAMTGRPAVPPPWAFGVWHNALQGSPPVLEIAQKLRAAHIPASALWVSDLMDQRDNMGWPLWTAGYYGETGVFAGSLHKLGFKVLTYIQPYVRSLLLPYPLANPAFSEATQNHYLVTDSKGEPAGPKIEADLTGNLDFTNPQAAEWWQQKLQRILKDHDADGWMEDFGEWVKDDHHFAGRNTGRTMATLYPLFYHRISYETTHRLKPDSVEFDRSGAPGSQAYTPVLWGGDQTPNWAEDNGFPSVVKAGITAGLSGFAVWGPDILCAGSSKELFIRLTEFGALSPVMRDHLWDRPRFGVDLWFDAQTTEVFRRYARLHVSLFPYLYTYAAEAARTGVPIIRHPMLEWPEDPQTYRAEYEYVLGSRILVAPVVKEGATTRTLYLPKGSWTDFWTGEIQEGGKQVVVPASLEQIPIQVRAGSILPFASSEIDTLAADLAGTQYKTLDNYLMWRVFPSAAPSHASFTLYDGTKASADLDSTNTVVKGESATIHQYEIVVDLRQPPHEVTLDGHRLEELDDAGSVAHKTGWRFDGHENKLRAWFLSSNFTLQVVR